MITAKLYISDCSAPEFVRGKQVNYTYAFHALYRHMEECEDPGFLQRFNGRFMMNQTEFKSLLAEAKSFKNRELKEKENKEWRIADIERSLAETVLPEKAEPGDIRKMRRRNFRLGKKLAGLKKSLDKSCVFGGRNRLGEISRLCNAKERDEKKIAKARKDFRESRILPFVIVGEANRKGNRFFDFSNLQDGICVYKPCKGKRIVIRFKVTDRQRKKLSVLSELAVSNGIPVTVSLSEKFICLTYDEERLNGFAVDEVSRRLDVKEIKSRRHDKGREKELIRECYRKYYDEQRARKLEGKVPGRCMAVDLNPTNIGYSVLQKTDDDGGYRIIDCGSYDLEHYFRKRGWSSDDPRQKQSNNRRRHELTLVLKDLFKVAEHYGCSMFVMEQLEVKNKDGDDATRESNRKNRSLWCRTLVLQIIRRRCNETGIQLEEVNPCYSSFIGNIQHGYADSTSASVEIGRRGLFKYKKNTFYPLVREEDMDTVKAVFGYDAPYSTFPTWKELYNTLKEFLGDKEFQHRLRLDNVTENGHVVHSLNSYNSHVRVLHYIKII